MSFPGFSSAVEALGVSANLVSLFSQGPQRSIGGIIPDCTIEEEGTDELVVTKHPVEQGAEISDHVYKVPARLVMHVKWSNASFKAIGDPNYVTDIYNQLLALQVSGQLFTVTTGKRQYSNMQMLTITQTTDEIRALALDVYVTFEQLIIATVSTSAVGPAQNMASPQQNAAVQTLGGQNLNPVTVPAVP